MKTIKFLGLILMVLLTGTSLVSCGEDYESRLPELLIKDMTFESGSDPLLSETKEQVFRNEDLSNYIITADVDWCFPSIDYDNSKIVVRVYGNDTYDERTAIVTITDTKVSKDRTFKVTQAQLDAIMTDQADYTVPSSGGEITMTVKSNVSYTVEVSADWIHYASTRGLEESTVTFTFDENNSGDERYGSVRILNSEKGVEAKATIRQRFTPYLEIETKSFTVDELAQELEIKYTANLPLSVELKYFEDWIDWGEPEKLDATHFVQTIKLDAFKAKESTRSAEISLVNSIWKLTDNKISITQQHTLYIPEIEETESGNIEMYVGDSLKINYVNTKERKVKWTSSDNDIVTVDENGQVKAIAIGEATVTLKSSDGKYSDKVKVEVKTPDDITDALSCEWAEETVYTGGVLSGYNVTGTLMNDSEFTLTISKCRVYNNGLLIQEKSFNARTGKLEPGGAKETPTMSIASKVNYYMEWDYTYANEEYTLKYTQDGEKTIKKHGEETTPETPAATARRFAVRRR